MRRRRPVLRAATMVGAGAMAYHAGKSAQQNRDMDAYQDERLRDLEAQQGQAAPVQSAPPTMVGGLSTDVIAQLEQLAQLRERGILNNEEFEAQKKMLLRA
jgi:BMFP domain-containing protein YqiC